MSGVVVVGAGHAGVQTAASLRELGFPGRVVVVSGEPHHPYERPPLSKEHLVAGQPTPVALRPMKFFEDKRIDLVTGAAVTAVDRQRRRVLLDDGTWLSYDHLVLATGTRARELPLVPPGADGVISLRSVDDAGRLATSLEAAATGGLSVVCLGAGFIGLEVAAAACKRGLRPTVLEMAPRILARSASAALGEHLGRVHRERGVDLRVGVLVARVETQDGPGPTGSSVSAVVLEGGERLACDVLVVGVGAQVNDDLARAAGLPVANGIVVDETLTTSDPRIHAVGDCAQFPDATSGTPVRLESVQNATEQARHVARSIATGNKEPYRAVPWFWTDQHGMKVQIAGLTSGHDRTVPVGSDDAFSILCFGGDSLLGVESVNRTVDHVSARRLLAMDPSRHPTPSDASAPGFDLRRWLTSAAAPPQPAVPA